MRQRITRVFMSATGSKSRMTPISFKEDDDNDDEDDVDDSVERIKPTLTSSSSAGRKSSAMAYKNERDGSGNPSFLT